MNKRASILLAFVCIFSFHARSQSKVENAIFWEVGGNELKEPSYLFGTYHLIGSSFLDTLSIVKAIFERCPQFAGEIIFDSTSTKRIMQSGTMEDSTLRIVLGSDGFTKTEKLFRELAHTELEPYNMFNPVIIEMMLLSTLQQELFPDNTEPLDLYFQNRAKSSKKLNALETIGDQVAILFKDPYKESGTQLLSIVNDIETARRSVIDMNQNYKDQNLAALYTEMQTDPFFNEDDFRILAERNIAWLHKLLALFRSESTFVAVGALHLAGDDGLVQLLRNHGYTVKPIALK